LLATCGCSNRSTSLPRCGDNWPSWSSTAKPAFGVVALLIPATLLGRASMGIAVLVHEGATILVVLNALRLLRFRDEL
jgi:hypothetical protein